MKWALLLIPAIWPAMLPVRAQPLSVYSEFARIDAQGNVVAPETPREIISPALVRNAFTSFQVVVQVPANTPYILRIGQNPDNAAKVTLYRFAERHGVRVAETDAEPINAETTQTFWMDVWIDKDAPVRRIKVEPQLFVNGDWVIYPMEMRVREQIVPEATTSGTGVRSGSPFDFRSPFDMLRGYLCDAKATGSAQASVPASGSSKLYAAEAFHMRNARQDVALASLLSPSDRDELRKRMGGCTARPPENPEFYLRLRDYFVTPLWMKIEQGK